MNFAPLVLFVYNRPEHTRRCLQAIKDAEGSKQTALYIFSDGPKEKKNQEEVAAVRNIATNQTWAGSAILIKREQNLGLTNSIIHGLSEIFQKHKSVIVLEDDLVIQPGFLTFMNHYLQEFENDERVIQVNGYMFSNLTVNQSDTPFLMNWVSTWGWATWKKKWEKVPFKKMSIMEQIWLKLNRHAFNLNDGYDYYSMKIKKDKGSIQSWGVDFWFYAFQQKRLAVFPPYSLVQNIGFDGSGTNGGIKKAGTLALVPTPALSAGSGILENIAYKVEISKKLKSKELGFV